jgi:hypothetical protein
MTVDEFYAFTDTRPDDEKWEMIGGEPILNAEPSRKHQWIGRNVVFALSTREYEIKPPWVALPGLEFVFPRRSARAGRSCHPLRASQA